MKEMYDRPDIEIVEFNTNDIITESPPVLPDDEL